MLTNDCPNYYPHLAITLSVSMVDDVFKVRRSWKLLKGMKSLKYPACCAPFPLRSISIEQILHLEYGWGRPDIAQLLYRNIFANS